VLERYLRDAGVEQAAPLECYAATIRQRSRETRAGLVTALGGEQFHALRGHLRGLLEREPSGAALRRWADFRIREGAGSSIEAAVRRVLKRGKKAAHSASAQGLHRLRLAIKHLRYSLEFFGAYYVGGLKQATRATRALQDALGDYQDAQMSARHAKTYLSRQRTDDASQIATERFVSANDAAAANAYWEFTVAWRRFRKVAAAKLPPLSDPRT
jgi:CHAD domain-containing protein